MASPKHLMTVNHLEAIPYDEWHRYELIDSKLYVSCAPSISHQLVLGNLQFKLGNYLRDNPLGTVVPGPGAIFSEYDSVIPDIVYVRHERWESIVAGEHFNAAPDLIVEILGTGASCFRDLELKRKLYEKYGVQEYWIVDDSSRSVMIFRLEANTLKKVATFRENGVIESLMFPGLSLKLSDIFTEDLNAFLT